MLQVGATGINQPIGEEENKLDLVVLHGRTISVRALI
jgi:hypothetical protein